MLKNISLTVEQKEVVCIVGPSGAGKSTYLRSLNRLEKIDSGKIYIEDKLLFDCKDGVNTLKLSREEINRSLVEVGMVFQSFNLFPHKTVLENLMLAPVHVKKRLRKKPGKRQNSFLNGWGFPTKSTLTRRGFRAASSSGSP